MMMILNTRIGRTILFYLCCIVVIQAKKINNIFFGFYDDPDGDAVATAGANVIITEKINTITKKIDGIQPVVFFRTENTFLKHIGTGKTRIPNPNWKEEWEKLRIQLNPFVKNKTIAGFFLGDELLCACVTLEFIEVMAKTVVEAYPNTNIWYNEGSGEVVKPSKCTNATQFFIPSHVSLFSTDIYHYSYEPGWVSTTIKKYYNSYIFPLLDPTTQQAAFVPGSFSSTTGGPKDQPCNSTCYREMIMQDAEEYFKWAKEDTRIGGIFPWHWQSCKTNPDCVKHFDEVGTVDMPEVIAKWKDLATDNII